MDEDFLSILDEAEALTDQQLSSRISSLTRLTDGELSELFPSPADKAKLTELMAIVKSATDDNEKRQKLIDNIQNLSGTVLKLVGKFA